MILFLNNTPIKWVSKRQATVESSTYGSEMVAGRITIEEVIGLRYKLRMLGVPIDGSCLLFGDNKSMITSSTIPKSELKKRHNANAYNRIREAVAARIVDLVHCDTKYNLSDIGTKPLGPQVFQRLINQSTSNNKFPPCGKDEGELKHVIPNDPGKDVENVSRQVNHGRLEITHPFHDRELSEAFLDSTFRNYVVNYTESEWDTNGKGKKVRFSVGTTR